MVDHRCWGLRGGTVHLVGVSCRAGRQTWCALQYRRAEAEVRASLWFWLMWQSTSRDQGTGLRFGRAELCSWSAGALCSANQLLVDVAELSGPVWTFLAAVWEALWKFPEEGLQKNAVGGTAWRGTWLCLVRFCTMRTMCIYFEENKFRIFFHFLC